jgi:hypothetical protein
VLHDVGSSFVLLRLRGTDDLSWAGSRQRHEDVQVGGHEPVVDVARSDYARLAMAASILASKAAELSCSAIERACPRYCFAWICCFFIM